MTTDFTPEQKRYLEGFMSGLQSTRQARGAAPAEAAPTGPDAPHALAQARTLAAGGKLADQEKWKRDEHPFDAYPRFREQARSGAYPKPEDNFRWRYHGLFYVAPTQNSYMCRMRIANGILNAWQFEGVADIAERLAGGYAHVTTRANLQIREIMAENAPDVVEELVALGITSKGSGADNIRNVTGSATAGIDAQELLDTRPHAREWHNHILNQRTLYGLPRKFNVSFDGGGRIATLEETNDIGFQAVHVMEGAPVPAGIYYRLAIGGISGHRDLARDTGVILPPEEATAVADAIVRVFIEHGDRTNRAKARLKYVLDAWGFPKFIEAVEKQLGRPLVHVDAALVSTRPDVDRLAHIGVHPQKQTGLNWIGVWTPLGRMTSDEMRALARIARRYGDGDIRLTVWQNLILSGVADVHVEAARAEIVEAGLKCDVSNVRAGLVACTGSRGCKFAASDTKGHALKIADHMDGRLEMDAPVNIHLTGCHHSCAQHYIGDIGMIGAKVTVNDDGDQVEGYHLHVGGGYADKAAIGRLLQSDLKADDAPGFIERLLKTYLAHRAGPDESFQAFTARHDIEDLQRLVEEMRP
ncbi:MAG: NirA family protein [Beijerinckiaceae bacterium]|nr:NirA family protein [Beijerinckiaceae bacterium]